MPKKVSVGIVTSDKNSKTRRVEIPRLVKHPKYGKYLRQKTICYVHDENDESQMGDTVEIIEDRRRSKTKRWQLVRVLITNTEADLAAMQTQSEIVASEALEPETSSDETAETASEPAGETEATESKKNDEESSDAAEESGS